MGDILLSLAPWGTDGLRRGEVTHVLDGPISVPVGRCTLGRIFNVLGEPVDGVICGGVVSCLLCWKLSVIALVRIGRCRTGRGFIGRIIQRYNSARVGRVP